MTIEPQPAGPTFARSARVNGTCTTYGRIYIYIYIYKKHNYIYIYKTEKTFKNEQKSKDAAAKKRPNTSGVGKINNYYEDIYIPPYNNTD